MIVLVRISIPELAAKLESAWSLETATRWTIDNPARGQCSVTALVVQDLLGGSILKTRVDVYWHFYNLVRGERLDLTSSQFEGPIGYDDILSSRDDAFTDTTREQYEALRRAVMARSAKGGRETFISK